SADSGTVTRWPRAVSPVRTSSAISGSSSTTRTFAMRGAPYSVANCAQARANAPGRRSALRSALDPASRSSVRRVGPAAGLAGGTCGIGVSLSFMESVLPSVPDGLESKANHAHGEELLVVLRRVELQ